MRKRLFFSYLLLLVTVTLCVTFFCINAGHNFYLNQLKEELISTCKLISKSLENSTDLQKNVEELEHLTGIRITIIKDNGVVVAESHAEVDLMDNHIDREEIQKAISKEIGFSQRKSDTTGTDWLYGAIKIDRDYFEGFVRCAIPLDEIKDINQTYIRYGILGILLGIILGSIIAYLFSKKLSKPIEVLTEAADEISEGKLDVNVQLDGDEKFQILADAFNNMSSRLKDSLKALENRNIQLVSILNSMVNGMIAVNMQNVVIMTNKVLFKQLGIPEEDIRGKYVEEKIRINDIFKCIDKVKKTYSTVEKEMSVYKDREERILIIKASPIFNQTNDKTMFGVLLILQDITSFRRLERMRKDFVSNVSHELKTPLTSIKGFVEILNSGEELDEKTKKRFLDIIDIESDRLYSLIQDLLTISEIENEKKPEFVKMNMPKILDDVAVLMQNVAKNKQLDFKVNVQDSFPQIIGIENRIKQMIINLADNAIKYTDNGEVTVNCTYNENKWFLSVKDTGIGISRESISRLFERFYRVDKGRSRKMGGTGLGLSIVKHIVLLHGGTIKVNSTLGKGTEFLITFPIKTAE